MRFVHQWFGDLSMLERKLYTDTKRIKYHQGVASRKKHKIIVKGLQYVDLINRPIELYDWFFIVTDPNNNVIFDSRKTELQIAATYCEPDWIKVIDMAKTWALTNIK